MTKPFVFAARSGLSNRLRAMAGVRALAEQAGAACLILWEKHGSCFAELPHLYELDSWPGARLISRDEAEWYKASSPDRYFHTADWFTDLWKGTSQEGADYEAYCRDAVSSLRALRPTESIRSRVEAFADSNRIDECVGIHVRLTDNVQAYEVWRQSDPSFRIEKVSSLEGFRAAIRALGNSGERVFLSTDNAEVASRLCSEFSHIVRFEQAYDSEGHARHINSHYRKGNVLERITRNLTTRLRRKEPESWRTTSIEDALVDLMLLSRCRRIIGTYYSSFSQISSLIGGNPLAIQCGEAIIEDSFISRLNEVSKR